MIHLKFFPQQKDEFSSFCSNTPGGNNDEDDHGLKQAIREKPTTRFSACCSIRIFIVVLITCLVLSCSIVIWLVSFVGARTALNELSTQLMNTFANYVVENVDSEIRPITAATKSIAYDFNLGVVPMNPQTEYLFSKFVTFHPYGIGFLFADQLSTINYVGIPPNEVPGFYHQKSNETDMFVYEVDLVSGQNLNRVLKVNPNYNVTVQDYWKHSFDNFHRPEFQDLDGVFGDPYFLPGGGYTIYYSARLYDPIQYAVYGKKTSNPIGLAKTNLSLQIIQRFLASLKVMNRGYVLLSQQNNDLVIGGSINTTSWDLVSRVSMFDLQDRNAGALMKQIAAQYGSLTSAPNLLSIMSAGVEYYVVKTEYVIENLRWNLFIVVEKAEVEQATNISTGISIAVTFVIAILGVTFSILIGHVTTAPLRKLEQEFQKIKTMEFDQVEFMNSIFREVDYIFIYLRETVVWLNEIRSFLPESVFLHLRMTKHSLTWNEMTNKEGNHELESSHSSSKVSKRESSKEASIHSANMASNNLFKIGLFPKVCSVVRIYLSNMTKEFSSDDIAQYFSKIVAGLSMLSKNTHTDFQVISVDEFQLTFTDQGPSGERSIREVALMSCLKFVKLIDNLNESRKNGTTLKCCIGVSSGKCFSGNLGNSSYRGFFTIGNVVQNSKKLSHLANELNCKLLACSYTLDSKTTTKFVTRPIDRIVLDSDSGSQVVLSTIFEIIKENIVHQDGKCMFYV